MLRTVAVAVLAVFLAPRLWLTMTKLPVYDKTEPWFRLTNLWTDEELNGLRDLVRSQKEFKTVIQDFSTHSVPIESPLNEDGTCPHMFLSPQNGKCVFPSRIDIASHYVSTGGRYGAKEKFTQMVNNIQSFQNHLFGKDLQRKELQSLFASEQYLKAAKTICGEDYPLVERVQLNVVLMLPGQDLPMHYDLPWFNNGANRFTLPQWLLLAMAGSGLWKAEMRPQVQGVAYMHVNQTITGGSFFLYPDGPGAPVVTFPSDANTGSVVDGIKVIHGVNRVMPGRVAPAIGKKSAAMIYDATTDTWSVTNDKGTFLASYATNELRMTLVWRSLCYKSEQEKAAWNPQDATFDPEVALKALEDDLRKRGVIKTNEPRPEVLEFALMLINEYVKYPVDNWGNAWFPFNYCVLPHATTRPWLRNALEAVVNVIC